MYSMNCSLLWRQASMPSSVAWLCVLLVEATCFLLPGCYYFIVFPFTVQFLGTYQVSPDVPNQISLTSYVDLLLVMSLLMGVVFELPVLCWLLGKFGILKSSFMRKYRRHAVVVILIVAAIITPTGDPFTLSLVAVPIYLLWELSILIVKKVEA